MILGAVLVLSGIGIASSEDTGRGTLIVFTEAFEGLDVGDSFRGWEVTYSDPRGRVIVVDADIEVTREVGSLDSRILHVESDGTQDLFSTPNDLLYTSQYGPQAINVDDAWDIEMAAAAQSVCVIDSGAKLNHEDLQAGYLGGYDYYADDNDPTDTSGHGTMMTGIASARISNLKGIAGASNSGFFALRAGTGSLEDAAVLSSFDYCTNSTARVFSMSFGSTTNSSSKFDKLAYAWNSGKLLVGATGNNGCDPCVYFPAAYPFVLAVGCIDVLDALCPSGSVCGNGSNQGPEIDVVAPGKDIQTTAYGGLYTTGCGTSQAAALVAGASTLLFSYQANLTNRVVKDLIEETATDLGTTGFDNATGWGRVNIDAAFDFITPITDPTCRFNTPPRGSVLAGTVNMTAYAYSYGGTLSWINLTVDGSVLGGMSRVGGTDTYYREFDSTNYSDGAHTIEVRCKETEGDTRNVSRSYTLDN
jgi:thermitase